MCIIENINMLNNEQSDLTKDMIAIHLEKINAYVDLSEAIDKDEEIAKLKKEIENIEKELNRANSMLNNEAFTNKAPEKLVEAEKQKVVKYTEMLKKVTSRLEELI